MTIRARRTPLWAGAILLFGWATAWGATLPDRSAAEILERLRRLPAAAGGIEDRVALWGLLVGPSPPPVRCGTAVALVLRHGRSSVPAALHPALDRLLSPPPSSRRLAAAEGFDLRAVDGLRADLADANGNGVPDAAERALEETSRALRLWTETLGWLPPAEAASGRPVPVILAPLPAGVDALALADAEPARTFEEDATATLVVAQRLLEEPEALAQSLIHQMAHALLWAYSHREDASWQEASAVALEVEARRDARPYLEAFGERLEQRSASLLAHRLRLSQGGGLWALFLDLSRAAGSSTLRRLWEELAAVPGDNLTEAAEHTFAALDGSDPGREIATYLAWGLFTGERDDGRHFPFAGALRAGPDAAHADYPAAGPAGAIRLEPWSGHVVCLETGAERGLRLEFRGAERGRWSLLALFEERRGGPLYSTWVPVDAGGRGQLSFPGSAFESASLIVANAAPPDAGAADFAYSVWHDPSYPFELSGLEAEATAEGVALSWTTDGETDLAGWNIYRSLSPLDGFARVNRVPIPAGGEVRDPLHYLFLDSEIEAGRRYYYYVEALTAGGFAERTPGVSARTQVRAPQR